LVGAFLSALGSFLVLARQSRTSEGIRTQVEENLTQTGENLRQTREIITHVEKTIAHITGGDSFCYVALANVSARGALLGVVHQGQYPLYDVSIRIHNLDEFDRLGGPITLEKMARADTVITVGNLGPNQSAMWSKWSLPDADQQRYNIFISARNGFVSQLLRLQRVNGKWQSATKVTRDFDQNQVTLYERIDEDFPRDAAGQVQWEGQKGPPTTEPPP
jgi:hypothetical protein